MSTDSPIKRRRLAFLESGWFWFIAFSVIGVSGFVGVVLGYNRWMLDRDVDHLFRHVLANGDVGNTYKHADARFQAMVPWPEFFAFAQERPHWFQRDKVQGVELVWMAHGDSLYVVMKARVDGVDVDFYCNPSDRGNWRLAGISPGLTAALPKELKRLHR